MVSRLDGKAPCRQCDHFPAVFDLLNAWKNPPPPDYRDLVTKWFWSKPWSIAVYLLIVGLPAVLGWVVIFRAALAWLRAPR